MRADAFQHDFACLTAPVSVDAGSQRRALTRIGSETSLDAHNFGSAEAHMFAFCFQEFLARVFCKELTSELINSFWFYGGSRLVLLFCEMSMELL